MGSPRARTAQAAPRARRSPRQRVTGNLGRGQSGLEAAPGVAPDSSEEVGKRNVVAIPSVITATSCCGGGGGLGGGGCGRGGGGLGGSGWGDGGGEGDRTRRAQRGVGGGDFAGGGGGDGGRGI